MAAFAVLAALSLSFGWRGYSMERFWLGMRWKWLATTLVMTILAWAISPQDLDLPAAAFLSTPIELALVTLPPYAVGKAIGHASESKT